MEVKEIAAPRRRRQHRTSRNGNFGNNFMSRRLELPFTFCSLVPRQLGSGYQLTEFEMKISSFVSDRVAALAPFYEYFRVPRMRIELHGDAVPTTTTNVGFASSNPFFQGVAWVPSASTLFGAATSFNDLVQFPDHAIGMPGAKPLRLNLGPKQTYGSNPNKWYNTKNTGTPPDSELSAGCIEVLTYSQVGQTSGAATPNAWLYVSGFIEFTAPIEDSISLLPDQQVSTVSTKPDERGELDNPRPTSKQPARAVRSVAASRVNTRSLS